MYKTKSYPTDLKEAYALLTNEMSHLVSKEDAKITNLSNASALLNTFFDHINWIGFYLTEHNELILGPFQGLPACTRIQFGTGVCGTAAECKQTIIVDNVHEFPGHIACDSASNSEIVVPMIKDNKVVGVLDIDSPEFARFNEADQHHLENIVSIIAEAI